MYIHALRRYILWIIIDGKEKQGWVWVKVFTFFGGGSGGFACFSPPLGCDDLICPFLLCLVSFFLFVVLLGYVPPRGKRKVARKRRALRITYTFFER